MGISDDIVPKYRHRQSHSEYEIDIRKEAPENEDQETEEIFDDEDGEEEPEKDNFFKQQPEKNLKKKESKKGSIFGWIFVLLLLGLFGAIFFSNYKNVKSLFGLQNQSSNNNSSGNETTNTNETIQGQDYTTGESTTVENTPQATAATPAATSVNKATLSIEVLNGNGISNSASEIKAILETAGFTIAKTANAKTFSYANTIVYYKTGKEDGANLVKEALAARTVTTEKSDDVCKTYDIVVVVGKK